MVLPTRGLKYKQLKRLTAGPVVPKSGHIVEKVTFIDWDGEEKLGFFKALDSTYPETLAKLSVLSSIFARLSLGERAAEDRLVFDDNGNIVGTVSIGLKDFKALNFSQAVEPSIPTEKEKVVPSTQTLLEHNVMELLVVSWFLGNDDLHPGNISLQGIIDFDMFLYWITVLIKGSRIINGWLTGTPPEGINIFERDFENFPYVQLANFTHWPTKNIPDNYNYAKAYPNFKAFTELARNPQMHNSKEKIFAQDQLFTAVLKILLTYQPEVLRARLEEYFGDLPLDYMSLDLKSVAALQKASPELFNANSNQGTFVKFAMELFQQYYDALYRVTVFYQGCEKNGQGQSEFHGVSVPSFCDMLHAKPSMYQNIKKWVIEQNQNWTSPCQLDLELFEKCYHQLFRDALVPQLKDYLNLSTELALELIKLQSLDAFSPMQKAIHPTDPSVTNSLRLFGHLQPLEVDKVDKALDCDKGSELRKGTLELVGFNNGLIEYVNEYFRKKSKELTRKDNDIFTNKINNLILKNKKTIMNLFNEETSWHKKFVQIIQDLQGFAHTADFELHIGSNDRSIKSTMVQRRASEQNLPQHTDLSVVHRCIMNLFDWVATIPSHQFHTIIELVIKNNYSSMFNWYRQRSDTVKSYLKSSTKDSNDNRLAYILCSGTTEAGALNIALINTLVELMLKESKQGFGVYFPNIEKAFEDKKFKKEVYTKEAIEYAKRDERFVHLGMNSAPNLVNDAIFDWINQLKDPDFTGIMKAAVAKHEAHKSYITSSRKGEVNACLASNLSKPKKLATILSTRGWESTSLNTFLYKSIIQQMAREISSKKTPTKADQLILQLSQFEEHLTPAYFGMVVAFCQMKLKESEKPAVKALMY